MLVAAMLWHEFQSKDNLSEIWALFKVQLKESPLAWLLTALILMPFNWLTELQKWIPFIRQHQDLSWKDGMKAILTGISFALFTPNRIGEYGGRILYVKPENHWKALMVHLVGSFSQYLILLGLGLLSVGWLAQRFWDIDVLYIRAFLGLCVLLLGLLTLIFFNMDWVVAQASQIKWLRPFKRFVKDIRVLSQFRRIDLLKVLGWSGLRVLIYSTQYFLLLRYFGVDISVLEGFSGIFAVFFLQTFIPLPPITALLTRGNLAILVWSQFGANEISILAATFTLWIINLILPALIGTFSLIHVNITKTFDYADE